MIKRILLIILSAALCLSTACAAQPVQTETAPEKTIITVLYGQSTSDPGVEDMLTQEIKLEFPEVTLDWESVDWGDYFASEMQARIASGEVPDMIIGKAQDVAGYQPSGYLADFSTEYANYINPISLDSVRINGKLYGIPYNTLYQGVLYNKDIFYRFGLEVPKTLDDMQKIVQRLDEVNVTPFASHFQENWFTANIFMQFAINQVFFKQPDWGDKFRVGSVNFATSSEIKPCFDQVKFILDHSWPDALTVPQSECIKRFANQEAAMFVTGTWSIQTLLTVRPTLNVGIFPFPNHEGTSKVIFEPNMTFMKNGQTEHAQLVDKIIMSLVQDQDLARSIAEFTQTDSLVTGVTVNTLSTLRADISHYWEEQKMIDASLGNNEFVWNFQDLNAKQITIWLKGDTSLDKVLEQADNNRVLSVRR